MGQQRRECPQCGGIGFQLKKETHCIEVHVPVGGRHGENISVPGEGNKYPDMQEGDVVVQLRIAKHKVYNRKGADLGMNYELSLRQALCGYKIKIPHVSGKTLVITPLEKHEVVQPGSLKIVHTMGLPQRFSGHIKGHLYIVMDVKLPLSRTLSTQQIASFKQILPNTQIDNENSDEEEESKTSSNTNSVPNGTSNGNQPQKKRRNSKSKPNKRHKT